MTGRSASVAGQPLDFALACDPPLPCASSLARSFTGWSARSSAATGTGSLWRPASHSGAPRLLASLAVRRSSGCSGLPVPGSNSRCCVRCVCVAWHTGTGCHSDSGRYLCARCWAADGQPDKIGASPGRRRPTRSPPKLPASARKLCRSARGRPPRRIRGQSLSIRLDQLG